ncbi:MAG: thiazole synthase [Acidobacteria bacterium]|jgi:thiazole synthase|nr:thiazole synthase [Acidobacteriota bacterium]
MKNENFPLIIGGREISNRFFLGTGKFKNKADMKKVISENNIQVVTVAMRRIDSQRHAENILEYIPENTILMINTSGARNAQEAIRIARLAREASGFDWIKIEVMDDSKYLLPDNYETIKATETLASEGFVVLPYMNPDLYVARELQKVGAAAVMPLGSLIGSGRGLDTRKFIEILIHEIDLPIIVDAGIGKPSQAAEAMEMGADAVLANTAVAAAGDPAAAARAFSLAVEAGRIAYNAQLNEAAEFASPSSPLTGFLFEANKN